MALQASALANALKSIFEQMETAASDSPKDKAWYAEQEAKAVSDQIKTAGIASGSVITSVSGGSGAPAVGMPNTAEIKVQ